MLSSELFLLDEANANFVAGKTRRPNNLTLNPILGTLFFIPFLAIGIFLIIWTGRDVGNWLTLHTQGEIITGEYTNRSQSSDDDSDTYTVEYAFVYRDQRYAGKQSVSSEIYNQAGAGGSVTLLVAPADPQVNSLAVGNNSPLLIVLVTVFWNLIAWPFAIASVVAARRNWKLIRQGRLVSGSLVAIQGQLDADSDFDVTVDYTVHAPDANRLVKGRARSIRNDLRQALLPESGTPVAVLYLSPEHHRML